MSAGTGLAQRWEITAHRSGEVSATQEHASGLELWLLALSRGSSESEIRGWLHDVAGVALEATGAHQPGDAIPTLLHHALTGLLFSHAEVWERPGEIPPCSVVFTSSDESIGFGWVGDAQVELTLDGAPAPTRWVVVRDSTGREAHAFHAPTGHDIAMRLSWCATPLDPASPLVVLEARWGGGLETRVAGAAEAVSTETADDGSRGAWEGDGSPSDPLPQAAWETGASGESNAPSAELAAREVASGDGEYAVDAPSQETRSATEASEAVAAREPLFPPATTASNVPVLEPIVGMDPERPSSGIARWLQRNFSWVARPRAQAPAVPLVEAMPPAADPEPAEQLPLDLATSAAPPLDSTDASNVEKAPEQALDGAGDRIDSGGPGPEGDVDAASANAMSESSTPESAAVEPVMPESATPGAANAASAISGSDPAAELQAAMLYDGSALAGDTPAAAEPPSLETAARSHEDQLAASAAALAAAISGGAPDPAGESRPPAWRSPEEIRAERVLEQLPERIPPTPEPARLTARAQAAPADPRSLDLPGATRASVPPGVVLGTPDPDAASRPPSREIAFPPAPNASVAPNAPAAPPRLAVTPRVTLRRPGDPPASGEYEIHSRALDPAPSEVAPPPAPLVIERVGSEVPPSSTPGAAVPEAPSAADPSAWVSRFMRPETDAESARGLATPEPPPALPQDESALLDAARRDEWMEMHRGVVTPTSALPEAVEPPVPAAEAMIAPAAATATATGAEMAAAMREPFEELRPDGTSEPRASRTPRVPVQHPAWPEAAELEEARGLDRRWLWAALVVAVLFGVGWLLGAVQWPGARPGDTRRGPLAGMMRAMGWTGPHYKVAVASRPDGAWIRLDGRDLQQRTPSELQLSPGHHVITLSFGQWGQAEYPVDGKKGEELAVDGTLWGSLEVASPDPGVVIAVTVDERPRGFAPLRIDSLAPGPHQIRFSGPGMASWGQTVEVHTGEDKQILTRALSSPSTGMLQIRATTNEGGETTELKGIKVFLDGKPHGVTPQSVELPRGPHSVRLENRGEPSAVQVIDLPGGNQRYATFDLGSGIEPPQFKLDAPPHFVAGETAVISATLDGVPSADVREMWLHVRGADGTWERYEMSRLDTRLAAVAAVGAVTFPAGAFGTTGHTQWYVSVGTAQGDEYFTELADADLDKSPRH